MITNSTLGRTGDLGNQMFQLTALISTSRRLGTTFSIPRENLKEEPAEEFYLRLYECFDLNPEWLAPKIDGLVIRKETPGGTDPVFYNIPDNSDLRGGFQGEYYFKDVKEEIKQTFRFRQHIRNTSNVVLKEMGAGEWVSVHVRRAGYIPLKWVRSLSYWEAAMEMFPHCNFLVLSDDMEWCKKQWGNRSNVFFAPPTVPYVHLCLMTMCHHSIIVNSSFSWWGAYLNPRKERRVVAPANWVPNVYRASISKNMVLREDSIYCDGWERLRTTEENYC